jgi:hypothetical protein
MHLKLHEERNGFGVNTAQSVRKLERIEVFNRCVKPLVSGLSSLF